MHTVVTAPAPLPGACLDPSSGLSPFDDLPAAVGGGPASPPGHSPIADMLLAARQLLGAWDRAMAQWPAPAAEGPPASPPGGPLRRALRHQPELHLLAPGAAARTITYRDQTAAADAEAGPTLTVQMLDGFQIWIGADPIPDLPHGKPRALLKLLLLQRRRPLSRARLCALFWPEADAAGARNSLNVTLHRLRRALGHASLVRHTEAGYQWLASGDVWLDTEQFLLHAEMGRLEDTQGRAANAIHQYEAALALYRSDLLDEGEPQGALAADAQALRDRLNLVLDRLAVLREMAADWHGCLRAALRHLGLDECNEQAHQRLMRCYARLGQPQLAERQYRACVTVLRSQLGLSPSDETTALYRRIAARCVD